MIGILKKLPHGEDPGEVFTMTKDISYKQLASKDEDLIEGSLILFQIDESGTLCIQKVLRNNPHPFYTAENRNLFLSIPGFKSLQVKWAELRDGPSFICANDFVFAPPVSLEEALEKLGSNPIWPKGMQMHFTNGLIVGGAFGELKIQQGPINAQFTVGEVRGVNLTVRDETEIVHKKEK